MSLAASSLMQSTGNLWALAFSLFFIGIMQHIIFSSILEEAQSMAID
jgi:hypothetical protein